MNSTPSQTKNNYIESPKTPGGISKSLLTPCRRVGLSRNWRKGSVSPFISPLSGGNASSDTGNELRKRKKSNELGQDSNENDESHSCETEISTLHRTPSRSLTSRKKTKTLVLCNENNENEEQSDSLIDTNKPITNGNLPDNNNSLGQDSEENSLPQSLNNVTKVSRLKSKNKSFIKSNTSSKTLEIEQCANDETDNDQEGRSHKVENTSSNDKTKNNKSPKNKTLSKSTTSKTLEIEQCANDETNKVQKGRSHKVENSSGGNIKKVNKSPNNLSRECMVVIQKNILKTDVISKNIIDEPSQSFIISDDEDVPLSNLTSKENVFKENDVKDKDDDFRNKQVKKLDKTTSVTGLKVRSKTKEKIHKPKNVINKSSQISNFDDDDDDFKIDKRTILIKKSYAKVSKPIKSKSTGSVTQTDIDNLQARINMKKNKLLSKSMTNEMEELRNLIKKWQTGCQNALTELFDLMKEKMPEQSMSYSEILKMFKIPSELVGYDSDNDCFVTPDDKNIILSGLNLHEIT